MDKGNNNVNLRESYLTKQINAASSPSDGFPGRETQ